MGGTEVTGLQASAHYEQLLKGPMEVRLSRRGYRGDSHSPNIVICVHRLLGWRLLVWAVATLCFCQSAGQAQLPLKYNHPNLTVDLGVGLWAWPLPMDWDGDGNLDLIVSCPDAPYNGTYFFKNLGGVGSDDCVFDAPVKVGPALKDVAVSHINGTPRVLSANVEYVDFLGSGFSSKKTLAAEKIVHAAKGRTRFNVWKYVDYNRDGLLDVMVVTAKRAHELAAVVARAANPIVALRDSPYVTLRKAKRVTLQSNTPQPIQLDGDVADSTPAEFSIRPHALSISVSGRR